MSSLRIFWRLRWFALPRHARAPPPAAPEARPGFSIVRPQRHLSPRRTRSRRRSCSQPSNGSSVLKPPSTLDRLPKPSVVPRRRWPTIRTTLPRVACWGNVASKTLGVAAMRPACSRQGGSGTPNTAGLHPSNSLSLTPTCDPWEDAGSPIEDDRRDTRQLRTAGASAPTIFRW